MNKEISELEKMAQKLKELKESMQVFEAILEASFDGFWITSGTGDIIRINKAAERILGIKASDVVGRNVEELLSEGFFDRSVTFEVVKRKAPVTMMQHTRDGKTLLVTGTPIVDQKKKISFVVCNERDITEINKLREQFEETRPLKSQYYSKIFSPQIRQMQIKDLVVHSDTMKKIVDTAVKIAKVDSTALITGEAGVGKSLIGKLIHKISNRSKYPFIRVNCGAIPISLVESEIFGYERGAFTGAKHEGKPGVFELADRGTLFLDEIGEIPPIGQVKLLRFLEDNVFMRVGGAKYRKVDVRVLAASNANVKELVKEKKLREDLFFRLNVVPIEIPPLRQRSEDIAPLVYFFLEKFNKRFKMKKNISSETLEALSRYSFPGNVRELSNIVERLIIMSEGNTIEIKDLDANLMKPLDLSTQSLINNRELGLKEAVKEYEAGLIKNALLKMGSQEKAAKILKVDQATIARKSKKYRITKA